MKGQKIFTNYFLFYTGKVFTLLFSIFAFTMLIVSFPFMLLAVAFRKLGEFFYQPWAWLRWKPNASNVKSKK